MPQPHQKPQLQQQQQQQPPPSLGIGLLPLLLCIIILALLGRMHVSAKADSTSSRTTTTSTTMGSDDHCTPPLHVPVFLTPSPGSSPEEARRSALSVLNRALEAYRQELVLRMKALAHMALDRLPDWRGHAHAPQLTAELQRRVWGGDGAEGGGGFRARLPACWEANERVLDRLLRLPEVTVGLPLPGPVPVPGPAPVPGEEGGVEEGSASASAAPPWDDGSAGNSSGTSPGSGGGGSAGGGYTDGVQVLTHLLRDWAAEGAELRRRTYAPILRAVRRLVQPQQEQEGGGGGGNGARILVPGAGLGRLAFELAYGGSSSSSSSSTAGRAYCVTALDVSPVMVAAAASVLALLRAEGEEQQGEGNDDHRHVLTFFPFVHDPLINQRSHAARFRPVAAPDPAARRQAQRASSSSSSLSLEVGDLLAHAAARPEAYDAVVTCFLIDTGQTPLDYLWAIKQLLRPGGHWINLGPLNYHKQLPEGAVQLTLEDLEWAAAAMGIVPQPGWALVPEPCAYRPEPFAGSEGEGGDGGGVPAFLRRDVYHPAFGVYRLEE